MKKIIFLYILAIITLGLADNSILALDKYFEEDRKINILPFTLKGLTEDCNVEFNSENNSLVGYSCLWMINIDGDDVFCTRNKQFCKTKNEILGLVNKKENNSDINDLRERMNICSLEHSKKFSNLSIQNTSGNITSIKVLAQKYIQNITGREKFSGYSATQLFVGMIIEPETYQNIPMINIENSDIALRLGIGKNRKYAKFSDFCTTDGTYKFYNELQNIERIKKELLTDYERELIKIDERIQLEFTIYQGTVLRIFPSGDMRSNIWYDPMNAIKIFNIKDSEKIKLMILEYFNAFNKSLAQDIWNNTDLKLQIIKDYQLAYQKN